MEYGESFGWGGVKNKIETFKINYMYIELAIKYLKNSFRIGSINTVIPYKLCYFDVL
jgi:hypothetical protein